MFQSGVDKKINSGFCVAPWVLSHMDSGGLRRLCAISAIGNHGEHRLKAHEFINSEYMKSVRRKMMDGELPSECLACVNPNRVVSYRESLNDEFSDLIPSIFAGTAKDGTTTIKPKMLDYRTDICNLKCRTCNSHSSSSWANHLKKNQKEYIELDERIGRSPSFYRHADIRNTNAEILEEFFQLAHSDDIIHIYFAGGEPTKNPGHLELLKSLVESGRAKKLELSYNTNMTMSSEYLEQWGLLLKEFRLVEISVSIDGVGAVAEYIRSGLVYENFEARLKALLRYRDSQLRVFLNPTITSLLLSDPIPMAKLSLEYDIEIRTKLMRGNIRYGAHLRVEFLPKKLRKQIFVVWKNYFLSLDKGQRNFLDSYNSHLEFATEKVEWGEKHFPKVYEVMRTGDLLHGNGSFEDLLSHNILSKKWLEYEKRYFGFSKRCSFAYFKDRCFDFLSLRSHHYAKK